jgi:colanic acid/amylovoran biosynthesis protein WcaK/AmsJ
VSGVRAIPTRIIAIGAGFGTGNLGVGALASGSITSALHAFPEAQVSILDYGKEPITYTVQCEQRTVSVKLINIRFSKKLFLTNNIALLLVLAFCAKLIPSEKLKRKLLSTNRCLKHVREANFITSIAGGDSFSDIYGLPRLLYISLPQVLVLLLRRPLILLPQTIGPFKTATGRMVARLILRKAVHIYTRDVESLEEVARLLGQRCGRATWGYDMGFALEPSPPSTEVQEQLRTAGGEGLLVGLNISGLLYQGGYTGQNQFELKANYRDLVRQLIEALIESTSSRVLLVPHVFSDLIGSEGDNLACRELVEQLGPQSNGRLSTLAGLFDQHQIKWVIGRCDFFVGSRMHACIAALSQCVPTVGLAYSRKFAGVLNTIGSCAPVVDLRDADVFEVIRVIREALAGRKLLRDKLQERMPAIKKSALSLFTNPEFQQYAQ